MTSMDETAPRGRATRLLAALAVLLGLLAMHGVASPHHAAAAPAVTGHAAASPAESAHPQDHVATAHLETASHQEAQALPGPAGPACHDGCASIGALCVAVLAGAALVLLLSRRQSSPLRLAQVRRSVRAPAPPYRHARGPDPVRELCVSRT